MAIKITEVTLNGDSNPIVVSDLHIGIKGNKYDKFSCADFDKE